MIVKNFISKKYRAFSFFIVTFLLTACASKANPVTATSTAAQPACQPSEILRTPDKFPEIHGTMKTDGELWALLFFDQAVANQDLKIVWRMVSSGDGPSFKVEAKNENGEAILPIWGPELHGGSTWERPGEEWGTGFNFPEAGCWTITATSGASIGQISLDVLAP